MKKPTSELAKQMEEGKKLDKEEFGEDRVEGVNKGCYAKLWFECNVSKHRSFYGNFQKAIYPPS
jgi:hypothetical protein